MHRIAGDALPDFTGIADAGSSRLEPLVGEAWAAVGDAGAAFDPVSGQGIANALVSGLIGGRAIADHLSGRRESLPTYACAMRATHERTAYLVADLYRQI